MGTLESKVYELIQATKETRLAADLYAQGYEPKHQTMRMGAEDFEICFGELRNGRFQFVALIRKKEDSRKDRPITDESTYLSKMTQLKYHPPMGELL